MTIRIWRILVLAALVAMPSVLACGEAPPPQQRRPLLDEDGDTYPSQQQGGRDCNDKDPVINPTNKEDTTNGKDDNCNGLTDEFTVKEGSWRLDVPRVTDDRWKIGTWNFLVRKDGSIGVQYLRCLYVGFQLKSEARKNTILSPRQWLSGLSVRNTGVGYDSEGPKTKNKFNWVHEWSHSDGSRVKIECRGTFTSEEKVEGQMTIIYQDDKEKASTTAKFIGKWVKPDPKVEQGYCLACYGNETCKDNG